MVSRRFLEMNKIRCAIGVLHGCHDRANSRCDSSMEYPKNQPFFLILPPPPPPTRNGQRTLVWHVLYPVCVFSALLGHRVPGGGVGKGWGTNWRSSIQPICSPAQISPPPPPQKKNY